MTWKKLLTGSLLGMAFFTCPQTIIIRFSHALVMRRAASYITDTEIIGYSSW